MSRQLGQKEIHHLGIHPRQEETERFTIVRRDATVDVEIFVSRPDQSPRPDSLFRPLASYDRLQAESALIKKQDKVAGQAGKIRDYLGRFFLKLA